MPRGRLSPAGSLKLLALLFVISLMASFIPYVVEQITLRRTTSGAFSVMQSINPAMAVAVGLAFGEIPSVGEIRRCGVGDLRGYRYVLRRRRTRGRSIMCRSARRIRRTWYSNLLLRIIA